MGDGSASSPAGFLVRNRHRVDEEQKRSGARRKTSWVHTNCTRCIFRIVECGAVLIRLIPTDSRPVFGLLAFVGCPPCRAAKVIGEQFAQGTPTGAGEGTQQRHLIRAALDHCPQPRILRFRLGELIARITVHGAGGFRPIAPHNAVMVRVMKSGRLTIARSANASNNSCRSSGATSFHRATTISSTGRASDSSRRCPLSA